MNVKKEHPKGTKGESLKTDAAETKSFPLRRRFTLMEYQMTRKRKQLTTKK